MALERELETFESKLPELKAEHEGKFALVHQERVVDVFTSYEDAVKAGYAQFGLDPFLVKQIQSVEQAQFISRFVDPCAPAPRAV
ncbi:MAG TPA: hypothetical protein VIH93_03510 [Thermoanaerobaculia bacterium]|jgi:hypothetical protein